MGKIAVIGLKYDANMGDAIIADSLIYLLNKESEKEIVSLDLKAREKVSASKPNSKIKTFLKKFKNKSQFLNKLYFNLAVKGKVKKYFKANLVDVETIIFAGGGIIECEHYNCHLYINLITKLADKKGIDIIYNAVGFNGEYKNNSSYRLLSKCLNNKNVRYVSVRENQNEMKKYLERDVSLVCDPACWSSEAFNIKKDDLADTIGIGLIRPEIFKEFGYEVSYSDLENLYYQVILKIQSNGYKYSFFTNGVEADCAFGVKLLNDHPDLKCKNIFVPQSPEDLLKILSKYRVILCTRMHAAICSYSMDIPSVALCWNKKLIHFYNNTQFEDRCIKPENFDAELVYSKIMQCYKAENCQNSKRDLFRNSILDSIRSYK